MSERQRWTEINRELVEFQSFLSAEIPVLKIEEALRPGETLQWNHPRILRLPGVYFFFDGNGQLLLVGSSMGVMRRRIQNHLTKPIYIDVRQSGWIDVVKLKPKWYFFAPALEAFLIAKCKPKHNRRLDLTALNNATRAYMEETHGISPE